ncbi:SDR family NAD(P)-dependent oxidoreductase, partial [Actinokineospora sp. PR83]|uniref:type I polyketide synthase n=1 Tax=Actinokineospora sp. PR83 TaxID=2884908 RepID=UPI001F444113
MTNSGCAVSPVAVVGLACRLPGASGPAPFWDALRAGADAVRPVPADRWPDAAEVLARYPAGVRLGGFLAEVDTFDAAFFGVSPREAAALDPQQRLVLELAWEALEDAGTPPEVAARRGTGVVLGAMADDYAALTRAGAGAHTLTGLSRGMLAHRVSHVLGLTGPSLTVDAAQAGSLVAVHQACAALHRGEADTVLTGGVHLNLAALGSAVTAEFGALSPTGRCHVFDARADGYVRGEGGVVFALRRLADALADGDRVHAVIAGSALNHDGGGDGLTVPRAAAQAEVIRRAHAAAGITPSDVDFVELHGTGTRAGDPVEAAGLGAVFAGRGAVLPVGSVKTNIGHLEGAAGAAGLLKAVLAVRAGELPASLHHVDPNPAIDLDALGLRVVTAPEPLPATAVGGVSSFSMGGANAHVVVRGAAPAEPAEDTQSTEDDGGPAALVLSARTGSALRALAARLRDAPASLDDTAATLALGRAKLAHRAVVVATDRAGADRALDALAAGRPSPAVLPVEPAPGRVGFLLPGQGGQRLGAGRGLLAVPAFAEAFDEATAAVDRHLGGPRLREVLHGDDPAALDNTAFAQPALFAIQVALARLLAEWGVRPDVLVGHSVGEVAAAQIAGVLTLDEAAGLVVARGALMAALPAGGAMGAVEASAEEVTADLGPGVDLAAVNGPRAVVVSGSAGPVAALLDRWAARGRRTSALRVSHAFHSHLLDPVLDDLRAVAGRLRPREPQVAVVSTLSGQRWTAFEPQQWARYWAEHARRPVRFHDAVSAAVADGTVTFLELGSGSTLGGLVRADGVATAPLLREGHDEPLTARAAAAFATARGEDWSALAGSGRRVSLPTYPFERTRHWAGDGRAATEPAAPEPATEPAAGVLDHVAAVLGHADAAALDADRTFRDLGMDSVLLEELRERLSGPGRVVPSTVVFEHPTPAALAAWWDNGCTGTAETPARAAVDPGEPIAVVAMACRAPGGVTSPEQLWELVVDRRDAVGPAPTDRGWALADARGGFLHDAAEFDADLFGISPREAAAMEPQQRVLLELAWEAFERAGGVPGDTTGVFVGAIPQDYGPRAHRAGEAGGHVLTGTTTSVASGRIAYHFGLDGPALTVDTACSSSLVALHLAVRSLRQGEVDTALAGGVTVMSSPGMFAEFAKQGGLAADGRCKAFSADADGTGWAEGAGLLVLRRLTDARRDGDAVLAVIRGSAVNSDGTSNGLTAPNGAAQRRVIRAALADAGLTGADVDLVEAHGTGTRLGDPVEAAALIATYGADRVEPVALGSLKSNIGHTQAAAGVLGVVKAVQAVRHGVRPATLHAENPTEHVEWTGVRLLTEADAWPAGRTRRAAVSSFGISGTNAHLVLEQAVSQQDIESSPEVAGGPVLWPVSGHSPEALAAQVAALADQVDAVPVARALASRTALPHRAVGVGATAGELLDSLTSGAVRGVARPGRTAFAFTGQGSQHAAMGRGLAAAFPVFRAAWDEVVDLFPVEVRDAITEGSRIAETRFAQPAIFAFEVAVVRLFASWGVRPDVVIGHSVGEIAAAWAAGVFSLADAAALVVKRGALMGAVTARGAMGAIGLSESEVELAAGVELAAVNAPGSVVVSGDADAVSALVAEHRARGVKASLLAVSHAFHSAHMDPVLDEFRSFVDGVERREPSVRFVRVARDVDPVSTDYWVANVRETVRFAEGAAGLDAVHVLEVGPTPALTPVLDGCVPAVKGDDEARAALTAAARLFAGGVDLDWDALLPAGPRADLPTYAFQRSRFWLHADEAAEDALFHAVRWQPTSVPAAPAGPLAVIAAEGDNPFPEAARIVDPTDRGDATLVSALDAEGTLALLKTAPERLWVLTRDAETDPDQAAVRGLVHSARTERPDLDLRLLDLPRAATAEQVDRARRVLAAPGDEVDLAVTAEGVAVRRLHRAARPGTPFRPRGTALITGGTGALGAAVARDLADRGVEHLVLLSRTASRAADLAADLERRGARVTLADCDAADPDALAAVLAATGPVDTVVHAAGTLDDATVDNTTAASLAATRRAKLDAARALDRLVGDVRAFVLFSSFVGITGNPGQSGYGSANAALDALARDRRARGLPATAVAWGPWAGAGMAEAAADGFRRRGARPL